MSKVNITDKENSVAINRFALCAILIALALILYWQSLSFGFSFDDSGHLADLASHSSLWQPFLQSGFQGNLYRPVFMLSLSLNELLFGPSPYSYHLINIILHSFNSILVFLIFARVLGTKAAFGGAALWTLSPLQIEAVANISGRAELIAHFFGLLYLFVSTSIINREERAGLASYLLIFASILLASLSKESALVYPALLILLVYFLYGSNSLKSKSFIRVLLASAFACLFYLLIRVAALGFDSFSSNPHWSDNPLILLSTPYRVIEALSLQGKYIALSLVPLNLSSDYSFPALIPLTQRFSPFALLDLILFFLVFATGIYYLRGRQLLALCILWFLASFAITSNLFISIGTNFAERLAYLP